MKLFHLSDLHLGKRVNEFNLIDDQRHILHEILLAADRERPDAVLLAGDLYDKSVPSAEAVRLLDAFLSALSARGIRVFAVSGNHDSPERIAFGSSLMGKSGVYLSPVYDGTVPCFTLTDEYGPLTVRMLPFLKPASVRPFFPDEEIDSHDAAVRLALSKAEPDPAVRNVLVAHQFVTGATRSDSEEISVGGADNVDADAFAGYDYVALGHLHNAQNVAPGIRYCGTPLKYSFSEEKTERTLTVLEFRGKGDLTVRTVPLTPLHEMRTVRGTYRELTDRSGYEGTDTEDYLRIVLTDEEDVPEALARLRTIYPNLMKLEYDNARTRQGGLWSEPAEVRERTPMELLSDFFEKQNGRPLSENQRSYALDLMRKLEEDA